MYDMDSILAVVENPTRRKILQAVVREPHYPLQLSKELGISQQAIVKNLNLMEKEGLVVSYRQSSDRGPERIFYKPNTEFTITIDMRNNMFEVRLIPAGESGNKEEPKEETKTVEERRLEEVRGRISQIDRQITEFDRRRSALVRERNNLIEEFLQMADLNNMDYEHRELLYDLLNRPNWNAEDISKKLGFNETIVSRMIDEILQYCREMER
ncbi:MAG: helix-turn-helix domain-containing protein [Candidatus Methanomethylophilus sp.]|nr:helix-turn-helix domain-containing protein [Methanomethylophilus sp.]